MQADHLVLADDQPKTNPWTEDLFGYAPFAKQLAEVIVNIEAPNGYVVGLHGRWGSGKSTVLNFVRAFIDKRNAEATDDQQRVIVVDFRPWIVSGHQDLIGAFFKVLSEHLGPKEGWVRRNWKGFLRFFGQSTDNLVDAVATVALSVDPSGGAVSRSIGNVTKKSVSGLIGRFLEAPSLQAAYEDLNRQLSKSGKRFLVPIDDIDRLDSQEIKMIMKMVKTLGRLPNVVYILTYDRHIVWGVLDEERDRDGPRYAEKIVQQEIELPKPSKSALLSLLDREVSFLSGETGGSLRWQYLVRDGVHRWIALPRDVLRLSNAVKFSWPALEGEIDPHDLLAMEGLRLFDEAAFQWVREHRDFIFNEGRFRFGDDAAQEAVIEQLKRRLPEGREDQVLRVLSTLFPTKTRLIEGKGTIGEESFIEVKKRRGVGSEAGYDAYFGLRPSSDEVPKATIDAMMSSIEDTHELVAAMKPFLRKKNTRGEPMITKAISELRSRYEGSSPALPTQGLLDALFQIGEDVIAEIWTGDMFVLSPRVQIESLIESMLMRWGQEEAGTSLIAAFGKANAPAFCADIFVSRGRELGVFDSEAHGRPLISMDDFTKLGAILIRSIEEGVSGGTLDDAPFYSGIVRSWAYLDTAEYPREWLSRGVQENPHFLAKVARGLVNDVHTVRGHHYEMRDAPEKDYYDLEVFLEAARKHHASDELDEDERKMVLALENGIDKYLSRPLPQEPLAGQGPMLARQNKEVDEAGGDNE